MEPTNNHQHAPTVRDRAFHILKPNAVEHRLDFAIGKQLITPNDRVLITRYIDERRVVAKIQNPRSPLFCGPLVVLRRTVMETEMVGILLGVVFPLYPLLFAIYQKIDKYDEIVEDRYV